jgi:hypothetical protein
VEGNIAVKNINLIDKRYKSMKPAPEWINAVGEAVMASAFAGSNPPGIEVEKLIEKIQQDATESLTRELTRLRNQLIALTATDST